jgi:hypothetical protein
MSNSYRVALIFVRGSNQAGRVIKYLCLTRSFVSQFEPKNFKDANNDSHWICVMQDELNQFERN